LPLELYDVGVLGFSPSVIIDRTYRGGGDRNIIFRVIGKDTWKKEQLPIWYMGLCNIKFKQM
jgi:hypothetical protein